MGGAQVKPRTKTKKHVLTNLKDIVSDTDPPPHKGMNNSASYTSTSVESEIRVKVVLQRPNFPDDTRKMVIPQTRSYEQLTTLVEKRFTDYRVGSTCGFVIKYQDEEGDHVTIANKHDWSDCLQAYQEGYCSTYTSCSSGNTANFDEPLRTLKLFMHLDKHTSSPPPQQPHRASLSADAATVGPTVTTASSTRHHQKVTEGNLSTHPTTTTSSTLPTHTSTTTATTATTLEEEEEIPLLRKHVIYANTSTVPPARLAEQSLPPPKAEEFLSHHLNDKPALAGNWTLGKLLGSGGWGKVYRAMHTRNGQLIAVKQVMVKKGASVINELKNLDREITAMKSLTHPKIVRYLGVELEEKPDCTTINILMEFVAGGSIASLLQELGKPFSEKVIQSYTHQILVGLKFLHDNNIVHRDIKGANILIDRRGNVRLSDFGASKRIADIVNKAEGSSSNLKGTIKWMAPEVCTGSGGSRASDIWSLGCTVVEMGTADSPWPDFSNEWAALFKIGSKQYTPPVPQQLSKHAKDFCAKCFIMEANERPTAEELLGHPWFAPLHTNTASCASSSPTTLTVASSDKEGGGTTAQQQGAVPQEGVVLGDSITSDMSYLRKANKDNKSDVLTTTSSITPSEEDYENTHDQQQQQQNCSVQSVIKISDLPTNYEHIGGESQSPDTTKHTTETLPTLPDTHPIQQPHQQNTAGSTAPTVDQCKNDSHNSNDQGGDEQDQLNKSSNSKGTEEAIPESIPVPNNNSKTGNGTIPTEPKIPDNSNMWAHRHNKLPRLDPIPRVQQQGKQTCQTGPPTPDTSGTPGTSTTWAERLDGLRPTDIHMSLMHQSSTDSSEINSPTTGKSSDPTSTGSAPVPSPPVASAAIVHTPVTPFQDNASL